MDSQYSIATIVNWVEYQPLKQKKDIKEDSQRTAKGQSKDTDKNVETVNNEKNLLGKYKILMPIPENYLIQPEHIKYAESKNITKEVARVEFESFVSHHLAKGTKFKNWYSGFQKWIQNGIKYNSIQVSTQQIKNLTNKELFS